MLDAWDVTACIVTRGDVDLTPILETLIFPDVIVWDNSGKPDWKVAGRYFAALDADTDWVYFQDDDTIVPADTQTELLRAVEAHGFPDCVANWGHGENPDGYDDLPLVCGGAIVSPAAAWEAIARWGAEYGLDDSFKYEADFIVGVLYRHWEHIHAPFTIRDIAYNGHRLADEPWQRDLKLTMTDMARAIRDRDKVAA